MNLLFFLLGMITTQFIIPLLDSLLSLILTGIEARKITKTEIINNANIRLQKAMLDAEGDPPKVIKGFYDPEEEKDDDK